jgi:hypothetical protein
LLAVMNCVAYFTELPAKRADVPQIKGSDSACGGRAIPNHFGGTFRAAGGAQP